MRKIEIAPGIVSAILAIGLLTLVAIVTIFIMFYPIPTENETLVGQGYGSILSLAGMVVSYFYGTTTSSHKDRETIQTLADTAKTAQTTLSEAKGVSADIQLKPGETAVATATESGTAIHKEGEHDDASPPNVK